MSDECPKTSIVGADAFDLQIGAVHFSGVSGYDQIAFAIRTLGDVANDGRQSFVRIGQKPRFLMVEGFEGAFGIIDPAHGGAEGCTRPCYREIIESPTVNRNFAVLG